MKILIMSPGADTGGQGIALKRLFDATGEAEVRSVTSSTNYIGYEQDLVWPDDRGAIKAWARDADVWHIRNNPRAIRGFANWQRPMRPCLMHEHGTQYRTHPDVILAWCEVNNAQLLVSTIDLMTLSPLGRWMPAPVEISRIEKYRDKPRGRGRLLVVHAPTQRRVKGTDEFLAAVDEVRARGHDFDVDVIENASLDECLTRKGRADIFFDQLMFGYGNNGLEAMAMSIPVLSGARDPSVTAKIQSIAGALPYHDAADGTLADRLEELLVDRELRARLARRGRTYVERFHSDDAVRKSALTYWRCALASEVG